jgi:hypothetical protein
MPLRPVISLPIRHPYIPQRCIKASVEEKPSTTHPTITQATPRLMLPDLHQTMNSFSMLHRRFLLSMVRHQSVSSVALLWRASLTAHSSLARSSIASQAMYITNTSKLHTLSRTHVKNAGSEGQTWSHCRGTLAARATHASSATTQIATRPFCAWTLIEDT